MGSAPGVGIVVSSGFFGFSIEVGTPGSSEGTGTTSGGGTFGSGFGGTAGPSGMSIRGSVAGIGGGAFATFAGIGKTNFSVRSMGSSGGLGRETTFATIGAFATPGGSGCDTGIAGIAGGSGPFELTLLPPGAGETGSARDPGFQLASGSGRQ